MESVVEEKTFRWLEKEVEIAERRASQFDNVDGLNALLGTEAHEIEEDNWSRTLGVEGPIDWRYGLKYYVGAVPSGHGDVIWAASERLANMIAEEDDLFAKDMSSQRVLELGAGAGIPSLAAASRGAEVFVTDASSPPAIYALAKSATLLRRQKPEARITVAPLNFGQTLTYSCFDIVLAADIIYNPNTHRKLLTTLKHSLRPQTGIALFTYALHKNVADDQVLNFFRLATTEFGFHLDQSRPGHQMPLTESMRSLCCDQSRAFVSLVILSLPLSSTL